MNDCVIDRILICTLKLCVVLFLREIQSRSLFFGFEIIHRIREQNQWISYASGIINIHQLVAMACNWNSAFHEILPCIWYNGVIYIDFSFTNYVPTQPKLWFELSVSKEIGTKSVYFWLILWETNFSGTHTKKWNDMLINPSSYKIATWMIKRILPKITLEICGVCSHKRKRTSEKRVTGRTRTPKGVDSRALSKWISIYICSETTAISRWEFILFRREALDAFNMHSCAAAAAAAVS